MKKLPLLVAFVGSLICLYFYIKVPDSNPMYVSTQSQILPKQPEKPEPESIVLVREIIARDAKLRTFQSDVRIELSKRIRVEVTGTMVMEKDKRFRMVLNSRFGKEMDIGSNDTHFWFWSKRMDPPFLHYARHEDLSKAHMRTALDPNWMMEALNLGGVNYSQIVKFKQYYAAIQTRSDGTAVALIDPVNRLVVGRYLYNAKEKMVVSSEVKLFQEIDGHVVPKELLIIWYEEGLKLDMTLSNSKLNAGTSEKHWIMPTMPNSIDMSKQ